MTEIVFSDPNNRGVPPGGWHISAAKTAVENASSNSPLSAMTDIEWRTRDDSYDRPVVVATISDKESNSTINGLITAVESNYSDLDHLETR